MRRPKSIKYSLCSLLFIIVHHSRFLLLVTVILINLTIPKSITIIILVIIFIRIVIIIVTIQSKRSICTHR